MSPSIYKIVIITSSLLAMEIWIQSLATHFGYFLDLTIGYILQQPPQVGPRMHRLELLLIEMKHLVDPSLVFELE